jgi:hypothetical protein
MDEAKQADSGAVLSGGDTKGSILQNKAVLAVAAVLALGGDNVAVWMAGHESGKSDTLIEIVQNDSTKEAQQTDVAEVHVGSASSKMLGIFSDTTIPQETRDSILHASFVKDSIDNADHTPEYQYGPQDIAKVQVAEDEIATVAVIVSKADGSEAKTVQAQKIPQGVSESGTMTDVYASFHIAKNQPKDQ